MGSHDPFGHLKHKLWPKERPWIKLPIWFLTIKSQESLWFPCLQMTCHIPLEIFWRGLQLCFRPHVNRRSIDKVMGLQIHESPNLRNFGLQLVKPGTKWHLGASPVVKHIEYYKREGGNFIQVWDVMSLVSLCLPMVRPCTKSVPIMH